MNPDLFTQLPEGTQLTDMGNLPTITHRFDRIVGNQLTCSLHPSCVGMFVKPTEVLEKGADGELRLVDKARS